MNTAAGDPFAPFEAWTAKEMADAASGAPRPDRTRRFTFTPATAKVYRTIWKGWITWLASEGLQWNQATSAQVRVDAFPGEVFKGEIERIGDAATSKFALLPNPNPSGNFTRVTQRLPLRIRLADKASRLKPGMLVEVDVDTRHP